MDRHKCTVSDFFFFLSSFIPVFFLRALCVINHNDFNIMSLYMDRKWVAKSWFILELERLGETVLESNAVIMKYSHTVVGLIVESKQQPQSAQRDVPASAAVATALFVFLCTRCLWWKDKKTLPVIKEPGKILFWEANGIFKSLYFFDSRLKVSLPNY